VDCTEVVTRADDDDRTMKVAACQRRACTRVDRCSKNVPNRATFGHFLGRSAGLAGSKPRSAYTYSITRSDRTYRLSGHPRTAWHRAPPERPLFRPPAVHYLKGSGDGAAKRVDRGGSPRGRLACLGLGSLRQPAVAIRRFGTMPLDGLR
jgi:hypothetical protein